LAARNYSNTAVDTTLVGSINNAVTSITVNSVSGFPASYPYTLVIEPATANEEIVTVASAVGTTLTVTRGEDGTAAISHLSGVAVQHALTARDASEPQEHINASTNVHGLAGGAAVVGTTTAQTLTDKTISGASNTLTNLPAANVTGTFPSVTTSGDVTAVDGDFSGSVTSAGNVTALTGNFFSAAIGFDATIGGDLDVTGDLTVTGSGPYFRNVQVDTYTSNDTWNKPAGAKWVHVMVQGAGGGGGGVSNTGASECAFGAGGGGGGYAEKWFAASALGSTETVTVGAGGAGGAAGNNAGSSGGSSVFDSVTGAGGAGGAGMANGSSVAMSAGGDAGGTIGADFEVFGGDGFNTTRLSGTGGTQGSGGSSRFVGVLRCATSTVGAAGVASVHGGGGTGAHNFASQGVGRAGGGGGDGVVVVTTYL
jgi:hypothetical protein